MFWPFHRHRDQIIAASCDGYLHPVDRSEHHMTGQFPLTHITLRCEGCARLKSRTLVGCFTLEQLRDNGPIDAALRSLEKASR